MGLPQALSVHVFRASSSCETQTELVRPEPTRAQSRLRPSHAHRLPLVDEGDSDGVSDPSATRPEGPRGLAVEDGTGVSLRATGKRLMPTPGPPSLFSPRFRCLSPANHTGLGTSVRRCKQDPASCLSQPRKGLGAARPGTPRRVCGVCQAPAPEGLSRGVGQAPGPSPIVCIPSIFDGLQGSRGQPCDS